MGVRRILVVDDSPTMQQVLRVILGRAGHEVVTRSTGVAALTSLSERRPDLVLVDAALPGDNGYALCRHVRQHAALAGVPVILVGDVSGVVARLQAKLAGVTDHLAKPFQPAQVTDLVARHLGAA